MLRHGIVLLLTSILFAKTIEAQPSLSITIVANSTCGYSNGILVATTSNGIAPYTYSIDNGVFQSSAYFPNLWIGTHTIMVKDANGNLATATANIINALPGPVVTAVGTNPSACDAKDATITATAIGGSPPYQYSLDAINFQSSPVFTGLTAGVYTVYVTDASGCKSSNSSQFMVLSAGGCFASSSSIGYANCILNGSIYISPNSPYQYSIDGINFQSGDINDLPPGLYEVTAKDVNGVINKFSVVIRRLCNLAVDYSSTPATCLNNDGSITAAPFPGSGAPPYEYSLDGVNFQTSSVFNNLTPGNYTVLIKDADGNIGSTWGAVVYSTCISLNITSTNTTCGGNNGKISVAVSNGVPPYQYSLDDVNFQPGNVFAPLYAGNYQVTVKDANGVMATTTATINAGANNLGLTATAQPATCLLNDGSFTITATGGTPPYEYSRDGINYQVSNIFSNLPYDNYRAIVRDANGCIFSFYPIVVPFLCLRVTATVTDARCSNSNGEIVANATNGIAPYQYSINGIDFYSSPAFSGLTPGSYTITVKDANNAIATTQEVVNNSCISITPVATSSTCGRSNGAIQITAANGITPYSYSLNGSAFQNNNTFAGLLAGSYTVTVKDANGLANNSLVTISDIPGPQVTATATPATCINNNGSITALGTGGTAPLQYSINTIFQTATSFSNLNSGNYTVSVKDANGCISTYPVIVPLSNDLILTPGIDPVICEGTSVVLPITSNGDSYLWSPAGSLNNSAVKSPAASPSVTTQYTITAKKGACSQTEVMTVYVNPAPVADAGQGSVICFGKDSQLSGNGGVTYLWSPGSYLSDPAVANPVVLKPVTTTTYSLEVRDNNNCQSLNTSRVTVTVTPPAKLFVGNDTSVALNQPFPLRAIDINNSEFTQYTWSPDYGLSNSYIANPSAVLDRDITYQVTARTNAGCEGTDQIKIRVYKGPDIYVPNSFTPNGDSHNDILKAIPIGIKEFRYFVIYNRWGQQVFRSSTSGQGWDGKLNGGAQNTSQFIWIAEGVDDKGNIIKRKGTVVVIK